MRLAILCLLLAPALAAAEEELSQVELLKRKKIARFYAKLEQRNDVDPAVRARILKLREGATLGGEYGCIHQALREMYPEYQRADALLLKERFQAAAEEFDRLRGHEDEYLKGYATFRYGLAQMNRDRFEEAAEIFTEVLNEHRFTGCDIESAFYLPVCLGQAREKEKAIVAANKFLEDYKDAPERYRKAMEQIKAELVKEWESPLYDLAGRMNHIARKIEGGETGKETQDKQKEVVSIIEELIKRAEEKEGQGQGQGGGNGRPRGNDPSSNPANRSQTAPGASRVGDLRPKPRAKPGEQWGQMRDKEREEVMQALKEKFPERYRELLEQYHRALAEGKRVTESAEDR